ncbi:MAG: hypothetical protein Q9222_007741, partial [Ikaeria aurantiellina]
MPRPKRAKVTPSEPIKLFGMTGKKPLSEITNPKAPKSIASSRGTNGSDDSDGLVTTRKTISNRHGITQEDATMSGALALEDVGVAKPRPLSSKRRVALSRVAREADHTKSIEALKAQRDAALAMEALAKAGKDSQVQIQSTQRTEDALPNTIQSTAPMYALAASTGISQPMHVSRAQATPMKEHSILAVENFKRRPRQPSILQIARAQTIAADSDKEDDTLDDFNPDDESTPFRISHSSPRHEYSSTSSRKRKLSTPEIQVPASQAGSSPDGRSSSLPPSDDLLGDIVAEDSQPNPPLPEIPASIPSRPEQSLDSDTLAPPR